MHLWNRSLLAAVSALFLLAPAHAALSLGSTVAQSSSSGSVSLRATQADWTTQSVPQTLQGVTATAYINAAGTVFAVSWSGPYLPNLQDLLGTYFPQMKATLGGTSIAHGSDLVIMNTGHMRHFEGYAILKSQAPANFTFSGN